MTRYDSAQGDGWARVGRGVEVGGWVLLKGAYYRGESGKVQVSGMGAQ